MTVKNQKRKDRLMPNGIPKWIRIYDTQESDDNLTVVFSGSYNNIGVTRFTPRQQRAHFYLGMNSNPFHPQFGICQHGEADKCIDVNDSGFAPAIGRKCHLGRRVKFSDLNADCQQIVISEYKEIWKIS